VWWVGTAGADDPVTDPRQYDSGVAHFESSKPALSHVSSSNRASYFSPRYTLLNSVGDDPTFHVVTFVVEMVCILLSSY
jgi:hypothetical protein